MPVEPPPPRWAFPPADSADEDGLVGVGADLEPGRPGIGQLAQLGVGLVQEAGDRLRIGEQLPPVEGRRHAAPAAVKQPHAERLLELADAPAQGRRVAALLARRAREAAGRRHLRTKLKATA